MPLASILMIIYFATSPTEDVVYEPPKDSPPTPYAPEPTNDTVPLFCAGDCVPVFIL